MRFGIIQIRQYKQGKTKLKNLGLTDDEIKALTGKQEDR